MHEYPKKSRRDEQFTFKSPFKNKTKRKTQTPYFYRTYTFSKINWRPHCDKLAVQIGSRFYFFFIRKTVKGKVTWYFQESTSPFFVWLIVDISCFYVLQSSCRAHNARLVEVETKDLSDYLISVAKLLDKSMYSFRWL